jgi:hypothetical protein
LADAAELRIYKTFLDVIIDATRLTLHPDWYRPGSIEARRQAEEFYKRWRASQRAKSDILMRKEHFENSLTRHFSLIVQHAVLCVRSCLRHLTRLIHDGGVWGLTAVA